MRRIDAATISLLIVGSYAAAAGIPVRVGSSAQLVLLAVAGALLGAGWLLEAFAAHRPVEAATSTFLTVLTAWTFAGVVLAIGAGLIKATAHWKAGSLATLLAVVAVLLVFARVVAYLRGTAYDALEGRVVAALTASGAASPVLAVLGGYAIVRMVDAVLAAPDSSKVPVASLTTLIVFGGAGLMLGGAGIFTRSGGTAAAPVAPPAAPVPAPPPAPAPAPTPLPGPADGTPQPWWVLAILRAAVLAAAGGALVICLVKYRNGAGGERDLLIFGGIALLLAILGDSFANLTFKGFGIDVSLSRSSTAGGAGQVDEPTDGAGATEEGDNVAKAAPVTGLAEDVDLGQLLSPRAPATHTDHVRIRASGRHSAQVADVINAFLSAPR